MRRAVRDASEGQAGDCGGSRNVGHGRYRAAMSEAYSVYWPQPRWRRAAAVCQCLTVLFGGPHSSEPSFRRATVHRGDLLYPIGVCDQILYVLGRMRVQEIVVVGDDQDLLDEYLARLRCLAVPGPDLHHRGRHRLRGHRHRARPPDPGRDPQAADLPAAAGTAASPARQRGRPPPPPGQRAGHLPARRVLRRRPGRYPGRAARRADSPRPATRAPGRTHEHRHPLLTITPAAPHAGHITA